MAYILASVVIICALCCGISYLVMWHRRRRRLYELASKFQGPPVLPIIGNAHMLIGNTEHILNQLRKMNQSYPSPRRLWIGPLLHIHITDPEHIKAICLCPKTLGKSYAMEEFGRDLVGEGLLTAPVTKWKVHRKLIQPTFNTKILESFVEIFAAQAKILTHQMERHLDGPEFETFKLLSFCTLDMICESAMGVNVGAQTNKASQYVEAVEGAFASSSIRFFHFWLHPDFIFYRTKLGKDQRKNIKYLDDFVDNITQMKKKEFPKRKVQVGTAGDLGNADNSPRRRQTFLDLLMELTLDDANLPDKVLRDEILTMVLAANDTSAILISFVMLMLASHPDVQDKVYQELHEIYGNTDIEERPVEAKDLMNLKYLERVIKETMRLFPPIPFIIREITEDFDLGEHTLPAGSTAVIGILNLHRSEKYWPDPLRFDPDRFLPEENAKRHSYTFMGFSGGPRNCIGQHYAMLSLKTVIATVLRRFIFKKDNTVPINDIRLKWEIMMTPVDPITLKIERRTRN